MMIIDIFTKHPFIACSYYRGLGVIPFIEKIDSTIRVNPPISNIPLLAQPVERWGVFSNSDIVYLERPIDQFYYSACVTAKEFGKKLWIDFDDDFLNIPEYNPFKAKFSSKDIQDIIAESCKMADVITVTTDALRDVYKKFNRNVRVVPNAFNDYIYKFEYKYSANKIINWRGSPTHRGDVIPVIPEIFRLSDKNQDWTFSFIGQDTWYMHEGIKNKKVFPELLQGFYWRHIKELNPSIQIVPLSDNQFNRGKSMCAWIEATYSGAAAIVPDFGDFRRPGCINYEQGKFGETLQRVIDDEKLRKESYDASFDYIRDNLLLSTVNKKRLEISRSLCEC